MNMFKTIFLLVALAFTFSGCAKDEPKIYEYEDIYPELIENCSWYIHEEIAGTKEMEFIFEDKNIGLMFFRCITVGENPVLENGAVYNYEIEDGVIYIPRSPKIEIRIIKGTLSYRNNSNLWKCKIEIKGTRGSYVVQADQISKDTSSN